MGLYQSGKEADTDTIYIKSATASEYGAGKAPVKRVKINTEGHKSIRIISDMGDSAAINRVYVYGESFSSGASTYTQIASRKSEDGAWDTTVSLLTNKRMDGTESSGAMFTIPTIIVDLELGRTTPFTVKIILS